MLLLVDPDEQATLPVYPDHADPTVEHALPDGVRLATVRGRPAFQLLSWAGGDGRTAGGVLRLRLEPTWSAPLAAHQRRPQPEHARLRLRLGALDGPDDPRTGAWREVVASGGAVVATGAQLTAREAGVARALLEAGDRVVEADVELSYRCAVRGLRWQASADLEALREALAASGGTEPLRRSGVVAAFLSLPRSRDDETVLQWQSEGYAADPGEDRRLRELALRALPDLYAPTDDGRWRLREGGAVAPAWTWSLSTPRTERRTLRLSWSASDFVAGLDDAARARHLPESRRAGPLEAVDAHVILAAPLDPRGLQRVTVHLRHLGSEGQPVHHQVEFTGVEGEEPLQRLRLLRRTFAGFQLKARLEGMVAPIGGRGWPRPLRVDWFDVDDDLVVRVDGGTLGLDFVAVEAPTDLFDVGGAVLASLSRGGLEVAQATLSPGGERAWLATPASTEPLHLHAAVVPPDGVDADPVVVQDGAWGSPSWTASTAALQPESLDPVTISLDPTVAEGWALVVLHVQPVEGGHGESGAMVLGPGRPGTWRMLRTSVFAAPRLRYRVSAMPAAEGARLSHSAWVEAEGAAVVLDPAALDLA